MTSDPYVPHRAVGSPPRSPSALATAVVVLAVVWAALQLASFATSFAAAAAFTAADDVGVSAIDVFTTYDVVTAFQACVYVGAFVVAGLWLGRARVLATLVSPGVRHARGPVWVWLGWVVPVVSLWFPYQVVRDLRIAAEGARPRGLGWWWATWLVALWSTNQAGSTATGAVTRRRSRHTRRSPRCPR